MNGLSPDFDGALGARMGIWFLRLTWVSLPFVAGAAAGDALSSWSTPTRLVATALLWVAWGIGLVATLAPRPVSLTVLRTMGPLFAVVAVLAAVGTDGLTFFSGAAAVAVTLVNAGAALSPGTAMACAAGVAYGTEVRHPLKVPPALMMAPAPIAVALVGAGIVAGPLLLAARAWILGAVLTVIGFATAALLARSLHTLSRRTVVLVPAGLVLIDPMTLADPVLFTRETVESLGPAGRLAPSDEDTIDLRSGAILRSLVIVSREAVPLARALAGRRGAELTSARRVLFAPIRPGALLEVARARKLTVVDADTGGTPSR